MLFSAPIPFAEAINSRKAKALLPNALTSAQLKELPAHFRQKASFSATVEKAEILQDFDDLTESVLTVRQEMQDGVPVARGVDFATARLKAKQFLRDKFHYEPDPDKRGTIKDLSSNARLNLKIKTDVQMAQGFGFHQQGQDEGVIDQWPAWELYRAIDSDVKRDWLQRWQAVGGKLYGGGSASSPRMIALKNDPIWQRLGEEFPDGLGNPYPPFAFGSGMDVREIDHDESVALGVLKPGQKVGPKKIDLAEQLKAEPSIKSERLRNALLRELGEDFDFVGDVLVKHK